MRVILGWSVQRTAGGAGDPLSELSSISFFPLLQHLRILSCHGFVKPTQPARTEVAPRQRHEIPLNHCCPFQSLIPPSPSSSCQSQFCSMPKFPIPISSATLPLPPPPLLLNPRVHHPPPPTRAPPPAYSVSFAHHRPQRKDSNPPYTERLHSRQPAAYPAAWWANLSLCHSLRVRCLFNRLPGALIGSPALLNATLRSFPCLAATNWPVGRSVEGLLSGEWWFEVVSSSSGKLTLELAAAVCEVSIRPIGLAGLAGGLGDDYVRRVVPLFEQGCSR